MDSDSDIEHTDEEMSAEEAESDGGDVGEEMKAEDRVTK